MKIITGNAASSLDTLKDGESFDLIFIDADKRSTDVYFDYTLSLSQPGSVIIVDNVVRAGTVLDPLTDDPALRGIQRLMSRIRDEPRVIATALQTVGSKGHDGFLFALVTRTAE